MLTALAAALTNTGVSYASLLSNASATGFAAPVTGFSTALTAAYTGTVSGAPTTGTGNSNPGISGVVPSSAAPGASVTISGTNFAAGTSMLSGSNYQVSFNGTTATPSARTLTQLSVTVPTGATSGTLTVTDLTTHVVYTVPGGFTVTGATSTASHYAYVADQNGEIDGYSINATTGALTMVPGSSFLSQSGNSQILSVAVDPAGKFVFAANWNYHTIGVYVVNSSNGSLTTAAGSPYTYAPAWPIDFVAVDPTGKFVYAATGNSVSPASSGIFAFTLNSSTGALTPVSGSQVTGNYASSITFSPSGSFAYALNGGITAYSINANSGALTAVAGGPYASGASAMVINPAGTYAYVLQSTGVSVYSVNQTTGALSAVAGSLVSAGSTPYRIAIDPSGQFVYVTNGSANNIFGYTISPGTGLLTQMTGSPFAAPPSGGITVDRTGKFVYATGSLTNTVSAFTLNSSSGALTTVTGSPFATDGLQPISVVTQ